MYEKLSKYYDSFTDETIHSQYLSWIKEKSKESRIMDLGCGTGLLTSEVKRLGYNIQGSDLSSEMLEIAYHNAVKNDLVIPFFIHNILEPLSTTYNIILMTSDVINYLTSLEDMEKALRNIYDALEDKGVLMFDTLTQEYFDEVDGHFEKIELEDNNLSWQVVRINEFQIEHKLEFDDTIEHHLQTTYSTKEFKKLLKKIGFHIKKNKKIDDHMLFYVEK